LFSHLGVIHLGKEGVNDTGFLPQKGQRGKVTSIPLFEQLFVLQTFFSGVSSSWG